MSNRILKLALAAFLVVSTIGCALSKADRQVIIDQASRFAADKAGGLVEGLIDKAKAKMIEEVETNLIPRATAKITEELRGEIGDEAAAKVAKAVEVAIGSATEALTAVVDSKTSEVTAIVEARAGAAGEKIARALTKEAEQEKSDATTGIIGTIMTLALAALGGGRKIG